MSRCVGVCAIFAAVLLMSPPASAAVHYAIFQGMVIDGTDLAGDFGPAGPLRGAFTAVFAFDPAGGLHQQSAYSETVYGAPGSGYADPVSSAVLYIGSHSVLFPGPAGTYGSVDAENLMGVPGGDYADVGAYSQTFLPDLQATLHLQAYTLDAPTRFVTYQGDQAAYFDPPSTAYWADIAGGQDHVRFSASLETHTAILTDDPTPFLPRAGGVPEPASWLLSIAGLGLVGAAVRQLRRIRFSPA